MELCNNAYSYFILPWILLFALFLWWQCHYILEILFCMCYDGGVAIATFCTFVTEQLSINPLSMMSLLHVICWLFYYWAHPIADDEFIPTHFSPLSCRLVYILLQFPLFLLKFASSISCFSRWSIISFLGLIKILDRGSLFHKDVGVWFSRKMWLDR